MSIMSIPKIRAQRSGIVCVTAYDYLFATLADAAGIDLILVGDSLGHILQGQSSTIPVTLDQMVYHTQCVTRAVQRAVVVADMPFLSYETGISDAIRSAGRLLKEGGAHAVKLEGGSEFADTIAALVRAKIPVMGHIGLMPQAVLTMGGYRVQGKENARKPDAIGLRSAEQVIGDARAVEQAGAFAVVVEGVTAELGAAITTELSIPTIGIGAGASCAGQILVGHDLLGFTERSPKFVKRYAELRQTVVAALGVYAQEVREGEFPSEPYFYKE
jgi:3-methyl-2-oxobutanoate hydroxymethyltransferase